MRVGEYVRIVANTAGHSYSMGVVYQILRVNGDQYSLSNFNGGSTGGWAYASDVELVTDRDELTAIYTEKLNKVKESIVCSIKEVQEIGLKLEVIGRFTTVEEENAYYISKFIAEGAVENKEIAELLQKYCCS